MAPCGDKLLPSAPPPPSLEEILARTDHYLDKARSVIAQARETIATESTHHR